jgi:hypothetical protein
MLPEDIKSLLIECLNDNIKTEGYYYSNFSNNLIEGVTPASGGIFGSPGAGISNRYPFSNLGPSGGTVGVSNEDFMDMGGNKMLNMLGLGGFFISPKGSPGGPDLGALQNRIGGPAGKIVASAFGNNMSKLLGADQFFANISQIVPNQEAIRREGLGYTKGWARLAAPTSPQKDE